MKVEKIDGKIERYSFAKIDRVVRKAFKSCTDADVTDLKKAGKPTEKFIEKAKEDEDKFMFQLHEEFDKIVDKRDSDEEEGIITIDEIQATIIKFLGKKQKVCVIERYIAAKKEKERKRELKSRLVKGAKEKLEAQNVQNQNANVDEHSFGGRIGEASRVVTKQMALDYYMTEMARNNHLNNEIYIHKVKIVA